MRVKEDYNNAEFAAHQLHYYLGLSEKNQRHFLGMEYLRLGRGSQRYLALIFNCSRNRIARGLSEIQAMTASSEIADYGRQRKEGGGRKKRGSDT